MKRRALLGALLAVAVEGCGYALVGTGRGILPEGTSSVFVESFANDTPRVGLEQRLTDAVLRELAGRARLSPVSDRSTADVEISGRILSYQVNPVRFDDQGRALEYEIAVVARVRLTDRKTEKALFENPSFLFRQPYPVAATSASYVDIENAAIEAMARPFARSLVSTILEGF
ncbi:MAG: LptE family protein [Holophagales bacterium]|nr:LptE family protein [Holophagales bacterium]